MEIYNAYFEGLDGFQNTQAGADRVRAIENPTLGEGLDIIFAALLQRNEDSDGVYVDVGYIIKQLRQFQSNVYFENK